MRASSVLPRVPGIKLIVLDTPSYTIKQGQGGRVRAQEGAGGGVRVAAQPQRRQRNLLPAAELQRGHTTRKDHVQGAYYQASKGTVKELAVGLHSDKAPPACTGRRPDRPLQPLPREGGLCSCLWCINMWQPKNIHARASARAWDGSCGGNPASRDRPASCHSSVLLSGVRRASTSNQEGTGFSDGFTSQPGARPTVLPSFECPAPETSHQPQGG